jgi:outer membrane protein W
MGGAFVRFRSSVYNASAVGVNSSLTYFFKDRLAIEGAITAAFAPTIYQNEHVKFVGYAAGPKYYFGHDQFEPWVHALIGGMHILPQTALSGQNGFEFVAGAGVDYNLTVQWAVRLELDYLSTHVFGQSQNNAQAALDLVFHF